MSVLVLPRRLLSLGRVGQSFRILPGGVESRTSVCAKVGLCEDMVSKGKPEDSSKEPGAAGGFPLGKGPVNRRVRIKGSGPQ